MISLQVKMKQKREYMKRILKRDDERLEIHVVRTMGKELDVSNTVVREL